MSHPAPAPRTAVITGAASEGGIGLATAHLFARSGWAVAILDLDGPGARRAAEAITTEHGVPALGYEVNVADSAMVNAVAHEVAASPLPTVGAVLPFAGIASTTPFLEVDDALWDRVIAINLTGTFYVTRAFLPHLIEGGYGRIITMSSVSAQQGGGVFSKTPYSAAKAGVLGLTRSLAREVAELGITVNAIAPGVVDTHIRDADTSEEKERMLTESVPMKRQGDPEDIAALALFLASDGASYITGTTQSINGGAYIH